jgi:small conductance mechanosensitive channel
MTRHIIRIYLALWLALSFAPTTFAQTDEGDAGPTTAQEDVERIEALVATLEDEAARTELISQLKALIDAQNSLSRTPTPVESVGAEIVTVLSNGLAQFGAQINEAALTLSLAPGAVRDLARRAGDRETLARWVRMAVTLVLVIAVALAASLLARRLLTRSRGRLADRAGESLISAVVLYAARGALEFVPVATFGAVAWLVLAISQAEPTVRVIGLSLIYASVMIQGILVVARLLVEPANGRSLFGAGENAAAYVMRWLRHLLLIAIFGYFAAEAALLLGLSAGAYQVLLKIIGLVISVLLIMLILRNRRRLGRAMREAAKQDGNPVLARLAEIWHVPALLYVFVAYGTWALHADDGFGFLGRATGASVLLMVFYLLAINGLKHLMRRGLTVSEAVRRDQPGLQVRTDRYFGVLRRVSRAILTVAAALILAEIWIGGSFDWLRSDVGGGLVSTVLTITLVLVGALILWELITATVERLLTNADTGTTRGRGTRLRTLLPLIRNAARLLLGVIVALTVLSELGINIAPFLAGAGIAGIAIGFGAQSLVKDVITGFFILFEDSVAVGDVVNVGGHSGVVESMSVRTVCLRDLSGNVHVVPFGEITTVRNMTKDFAYALIEAGVAYKENVDDVVEVLREIGEDLRQDEDFGPLILEPLDVLGLDSFGDSAVNIRVRLKTIPGKQWGVRREFHRRMKAVFDARGIEIPFPHRTVYFGTEDKSDEVAALARTPARPRPDAEDSGPDL